MKEGKQIEIYLKSFYTLYYQFPATAEKHEKWF